VRENLTTASLETFARGIWVDGRGERSAAERIIQDLRVRTPGPEELMLRLSGGNQQKLIVGRWLLRGSRILILDDPTSGIDVGAKEELYKLIRALTREGTSVLISSSELPELLAIADRIMVLHEGSLAGSLPRAEFDQRKVIELAVIGNKAHAAH
jgi:ribose transport system ATP-binding protein